MALQHPQVLMPPPALYLGGLLMGYGLDQALNPPPIAFPGQPWLALLLLIFGVLLVVTAVWQLRHGHTTIMPHRAASTLITKGAFALSRNPIYLGFTLLYLALVLQQASLGMLAMLFPVLWVIHGHVIAAEESFHAQQFGSQWQDYCARVRRWL
ncbi:MAG: isoprenylcysteine carboxylmethyltransferase family protein [Alcanivorax sp.]|nr:isoprenylcysteine carboxylmethyltransferase family protein [Alcanivorax sp.]